MDKLDQYRQIVQHLLLAYGDQKLSYGDVETEVIFDNQRDHYQVLHVGWNQDQFVFGCSIHIDIKNDKVWIQWNSTEEDIAAVLVARGVAKEDIVIGLHPPHLRHFTDYAIG